MKLYVKMAVLLSVLLLGALPGSAREFLAIEKIIVNAASITAEKYPDADEVLVDDFIQVAYQPDGSAEMWDDTALKILTEKGKRDNRTLTLHFNTAYGTNYFTQVEIIKPGGKIVPIDVEANSNVMADPEQMDSNIYNPNSKVLTLSVPGLEVGDILRYVAYDRQTKSIVPDTWSDYQVFEGPTPIERLTYQVIAPSERPLQRIVLKAEVPGTVSYDKTETGPNGHTVHTWIVRNVPRMFDEPSMPTRHTVVQRLLVSTLDSWEELSIWYWNLCKPRLDATTPEMKAKTEELVQGRITRMEKIQAIFNFVSQDIRYMGITPEEEAPGYEPHDVGITFEKRYGVCRDKAALLASMLRLAGIDAFPVIIMSGPKKDEEVPQPFFNHAVTAALDEDGNYILMDSTDENTKDIFPSYLQDMSYLVARPEGETLLTSPIIPATDNLLTITSSGTLDSSGMLQVESVLAFEGINDTVYRGHLTQIKPEERHRFFEGHLKKTMPSAVLDSLEILPEELRDTSRPLVVKLSFSAEDLLIEGPANKMFKPPRLGGSLGYANFLIGETGLESRKYPLYTQMTAGIREILSLDIPSDLGGIKVPEYMHIDTEPLTWDMRVAQRNGVLSTTNTFLLNTVEFSPEQYLELKRNLQEIEYNLRKSLVIDSTTTGTVANVDIAVDGDADVRMLDQQLRIELEGTDAWTQVQRTKIEVLTYAGKKDNSEIKIPYNPAWQQIALNKATVTQPDGTVRELDREELNLMDAPWVASAPRYPAERILVASLPGVEIGSVIEYEVESKVFGKPFFSTLQLFNGHEPVKHKQVEIAAPETITLSVLNTGIDEERTVSDGTITYVWTATNQPGVKQEEGLPPWWTFNPAVFVSAGNWEQYAKTINDRLVAAATGQANAAELARTITAPVSGERNKAIALRDWVAKNLRTAGPAFTDLPLDAITKADKTLEDRYGNNADCMVVLYALLKAAQFDPEFVLTGGVPLIPEAAEPLLGVPARNAFDTVLVRIDVEGQPVYFDGSSHYAELGASAFDHRAMLDLSSGTLGAIHVAPGKDDRTHVMYEMAIDNSGTMELTQTATIQGTQFEAFHGTYAEMTPENLRRHYLEMVSGVSQSAAAASDLETDYDSYPGKLSFTVAAPRFGVVDCDDLYFTLPSSGLLNMLQYRSNKRSLPLAWENHIDSLVEFIITLPENYEPAILPRDFSWAAPKEAGTISVTVDYRADEHAIYIVQVADIKPALIPADEFPEIIKAGRTLAHPDMRTILLKRKD